MPETWYVMADGSAGDPAEIKPGKDGRLVHADGRKVAYAEHGPRSRSVDPEAERAKAAADAAEAKAKAAADAKAKAEAAADAKAAEKAAKEMRPETPAGGYTTRQSKAE